MLDGSEFKSLASPKAHQINLKGHDYMVNVTGETNKETFLFIFFCCFCEIMVNLTSLSFKQLFKSHQVKSLEGKCLSYCRQGRI